MIKIGVTGGIGSGKSTVCKIIESLGYPVFYSDIEAKRIVSSDNDIKNSIVTLLGHESFHSNGDYNSTFVASRVFDDKVLLQQLNQIIHPEVKKAFDIFCTANATSKLIFQEHPLLFENDDEDNFDDVIYISAPSSFRIENVLKRDTHRTKTTIQNIIDNQFPEHKAIKHTDLIIFNDGQESLIEQLDEIIEIISL